MGKRVFIAEKHDMAKKMAAFLGKGQNKDGYIELQDDIVTWCIGHILETAPPEEYDKKWQKWSFETLPIIPPEWKLKAIKSKQKQVNAIKGLIKRKDVDVIVNAGDPGREGQLIVDEVLYFCGNKKKVERINLNALDHQSIKKAMNSIEDNSKYTSLYWAGVGRQRADWLIGMNMTRAYTLLGQRKGGKGVLTVGRVQSPTLALVVKRDREIENFVPEDYWTIKAEFLTQNKDDNFTAKWMPNAQEKEENWVDGEKIMDESKAQSIVQKINGQQGQITDFKQERVKEAAPLPFDLSTLQTFANSRFGFTLQQTLDICQSLYEKGYTSYPRTDCQYLPESQIGDGAQVLQAIGETDDGLIDLTQKADTSLKSKVWNDKKIGEHHAIIPTVQSGADLTDQEQKIYRVVAQRYLAQFFPLCEADKTRIEVEVEQEVFVANGKIIQLPGWQEVFGGQSAIDESEKDDDSNEDEDDSLLPEVAQGESVFCQQPNLNKSQTKPPPYYTQGSLGTAMKQVHKHVDDPNMKKKLKTVEGIGRSATRAAIVENLLKRGLLLNKSKKVISSDVGKALVDALPAKLVDPALTAMWETALDGISAGKLNFDQFYDKQITWINKLVDTARSEFEALPAPASKPQPKSTGRTCPKCGKGEMVERKAKKGPNAGKVFYGCNNFPECKNIENPDQKKKK